MISRSKLWQANPPQLLAAGFLAVITMGALLLKAPFSLKGNNSLSWVDAFFTATSATTVTGLVVVDTGTHFTLIGQTIIMILMQIGGLGLMTFAVMIALLLGKRIGLISRILIQESFNQTSLGGMVPLVKLILIFAFSVELIAFGFLAFRWVPEYGWKDGLFTSAFHSISAFNNAGFSLWSDSLTGYVGDPLVNLTITLLFISGGIGFVVLADLFHKKSFRRLQLHTKLMLIGTLALNLLAMALIFALEYANPNTLGALSGMEKVWAAYFQAVTPRTAGFNTLDYGAMTDGSITLTMVLMFIGAGSASTGSGIKLTTFLVILIAMITYLRGRKEAVVFKETISSTIIHRSLAITAISALSVGGCFFLLTITESTPFVETLFEAVSAFGTVGLSMGITAELSSIGKIIIMVLMFIGRVGPVTLAFALAKTESRDIRYAKGEVYTG
ncbi:trk system potassium uptake protein TrkH [Alkalihalobacillus xiaoxiensis]|uniref:Trk system potassium uptake protein TrkH n=1 Tax=Shouchella xiaoxiensis TaxID=766895 RepID=A0ABS2SN90_9BACI|nr:TrkH family potassium uptake protein [Shouchella xiaoxiensis]MBM7836987.1 trk system potassium uptake protein TrkH [Shouchella xiaoxiensis]